MKLKFDKAVLYDYSWKADFSGSPCGFLRKNKIDYVVYFLFDATDKNQNHSADFHSRLKESLLKGECSKVVSGLESEKLVNSTTFKIT